MRSEMLSAWLDRSTENRASTARSRSSVLSDSSQPFNDRLNSWELGDTCGRYSKSLPETCQENVRCCITPFWSERTTRIGSGVSRIMPTIEESGTIFTMRGMTLRYGSLPTICDGNPGPSSEYTAVTRRCTGSGAFIAAYTARLPPLECPSSTIGPRHRRATAHTYSHAACCAGTG